MQELNLADILSEKPRGRNGIVALAGRANVGKSTLLNTILEEKVSIVSNVAQTTRNLIRAILTEPRGQLVFLDTPGVHQASYDLGKIMNRIARNAAEGTDLMLMVLDTSTVPRAEDEGWFRRIVKYNLQPLMVLNKSDLGSQYEDDYRQLWENVCAEKQATPPTQWLHVSATTGQGIPELLTAIFERMPEGPPLFPDDVLTDFPRKLAVGDMIREKLFAVLKQELPHAVAVQVRDIDETNDKWTIHADILVDRPSQKGIVIGKKGRLLKNIRHKAQKEIAETYEVPVTLTLWVKVERNWAKNHWILKQLGYV
ncbi:MAG: GTPase Era [Candidatus Pacebacteria bacterium]|nr:GTPase Era [Candidatus Paceibacterota bacterium]